jgi:hypothetical protein
MRSIKATFERLDEITLERAYGSVGVYVLWSGKSQLKPTYIGEGVILKRFAAHVDNLPWPIDGILAILGDNTSTNKTDAEILEAVLLDIAADIDRSPTKNQHPGKTGRVDDVFKRHGVMKIHITGYAPLLHPKNRPMLEKKIVELRQDMYGEVELIHPWKRRPKF